MSRPGRRAAVAEHAAGASVPRGSWIEESSPITLRESTHGTRIFELTVGGATVFLAGNRVRVGGDREWALRVSPRRASVRSGRESLAKARRVPHSPSQWVIDDGTREFWISKSEDRGVDKARSSVHMWGKDTHSVTRRRGTISHSDNGTAAAVVDLTYEVESRLRGKVGGARDMKGEFSGRIDLQSPVPVAVAVLSLRLTLSRWAKRPPQTGTWVFVPSSGG